MRPSVTLRKHRRSINAIVKEHRAANAWVFGSVLRGQDIETSDLGDEQAFYENTLVQDAVIRNLEIIGEASNNVDKHFPQFVEEHGDVPFVYAYGNEKCTFSRLF